MLFDNTKGKEAILIFNKMNSSWKFARVNLQIDIQGMKLQPYESYSRKYNAKSLKITKTSSRMKEIHPYYIEFEIKLVLINFIMIRSKA